MSNQITKWLTDEVEPRIINDNHLIIDIANSQANYSLNLKINEHWMSYAAELIPDVDGRRVYEMYEYLLKINARLNSAYIALENDRLILVRNDILDEIDQNSLMRNIKLFDLTHEYAYDLMMKKNKELQLVFKKPS
jgi:hypothetical protein